MDRTLASALLGALALAAVTSSAHAYPTRDGKPVEFLIITSDLLAPSFAPLADWKTQTGVPAIVRPLSAVIADHPVAFDDAERVRLEIRDAWAAGAKWVLLGGDASVVPKRLARSSFFGGNDIPTDLYFQCLDGDWDANGNHIYGEAAFAVPSDNADLVPEVWLGRAPVSTLVDAARFVQKTIQVQRTPAGDYEHRSLECAEVLFPDNWNPGDPDPSFDGSDIVEPLLPYFDPHSTLAVTRLYERFTNPALRPGALAETRAAVLAQMNAGVNQALVIGVGNSSDVRTEVLGQLYGCGADGSRGAVDHDAPVGQRIRLPQTRQRDDPAVANCGGFLEAHAGRLLRQGALLADADILRVRAASDSEDVVPDLELGDGCAHCLDVSGQL